MAIAAAARRRLEGLSTPAANSILRALSDVRLLRCIQPAGSATLYEHRVGANHHHFYAAPAAR
jgi:Fur family ferric uptake transcriptional regulator